MTLCPIEHVTKFCAEADHNVYSSDFFTDHITVLDVDGNIEVEYKGKFSHMVQIGENHESPVYFIDKNPINPLPLNLGEADILE